MKIFVTFLAIMQLVTGQLRLSGEVRELAIEPKNGEHNIYYDLLVGGNLVRTDYEKGTGQIVAQIRFSGESLPLVAGGWVDEAEQRAVLRVVDQTYSETFLGRIYFADLNAASSTRATSLVVDFNEIITDLPAGPHSMLVRLPSRGKGSWVVTDTRDNYIFDSASLVVEDFTISGQLADGIAFVERYREEARILTVNGGKVEISEPRLAFPIRSTKPTPKRYGLVTGQAGTLFAEAAERPSYSRLYLFGVRSGELIAASDPRRHLNGIFWIQKVTDTDRVRIYCIEQVVEGGRWRENGKLFQFDVERGVISETLIQDFNPQTQRVLLDENDGPIVVDIRPLAALSILRIGAMAGGSSYRATRSALPAALERLRDDQQGPGWRELKLTEPHGER